MRCFRPGATRGTWSRCASLGRICSPGNATSVDRVKGATLLKKACEGGLSGPCKKLGREHAVTSLRQGRRRPDGSACAYTHQVYTALVIRLVVLSKQAEKDPDDRPGACTRSSFRIGWRTWKSEASRPSGRVPGVSRRAAEGRPQGPALRSDEQGISAYYPRRARRGRVSPS